MTASAVAREVRVSTGYTPRPWQRIVHRAIASCRFSVLVVHRRGGKTVLALNALIDAALRCHRPDPRFAYLAPFLKQGRDVAWAILKQYTRAIPGVEYHESTLEVRLPNGARIRIYGADNADALRGIYLDGVVLDEVADMDPPVWGEIIRPTLADRKGWAIFIGTPKGINLFSQLYFAAEQDAGWYAARLTWRDTDALPEEEIELARSAMTDAQFRQEFECDFQAAVENALIPLEGAIKAGGQSYREDQYRFAAKVLGVDVARYGDGRSVIFRRQGLVAFRPMVLKGLDTMEIAAAVAREIVEWKPDGVFVDVGGIGAGVVDRLKQLGHTVIPVDFGGKAGKPRFQNKRAEMWWDMAAWIKAGGAIPPMTELNADLCAPTYTYANAAGRFELESKDQMRERGMPSPDLGDALACTFAFPVAARADLALGGALHRPRVTTGARGYNPRERRAVA